MFSPGAPNQISLHTFVSNSKRIQDKHYQGASTKKKVGGAGNNLSTVQVKAQPHQVGNQVSNTGQRALKKKGQLSNTQSLTNLHGFSKPKLAEQLPKNAFEQLKEVIADQPPDGSAHQVDRKHNTVKPEVSKSMEPQLKSSKTLYQHTLGKIKQQAKFQNHNQS